MKRLLPLLLCLAFLPSASAAENFIARKSVSLDAAKRLVAAAESEAAKRGLKVSIAVLDEAGRLVHFSRMDGTSNSTVDVAVRKAEHAVNFRRDTVFHQDLLSKGNNVVLGLPHSLPIEGGLMLKVGEEVVGAVGVSGAQSSIDAEIARAGMKAAGF